MYPNHRRLEGFLFVIIRFFKKPVIHRLGQTLARIGFGCGVPKRGVCFLLRFLSGLGYPLQIIGHIYIWRLSFQCTSKFRYTAASFWLKSEFSRLMDTEKKIIAHESLHPGKKYLDTLNDTKYYCLTLRSLFLAGLSIRGKVVPITTSTLIWTSCVPTYMSTSSILHWTFVHV